MKSNSMIYERLQNSRSLPSLPQVLLKLIETCEKDDVELSAISRIISKDAAISSKVLTLVNSSYFTLNTTFSNLNQAVVYLGADTIKNIAITASVQQVFNNLKDNDDLAMEQFWWNSFSTAVYAGRIARKTESASAEEAYLAGLLHNIGELLLWMNFPKEWSAVSAQAEDCELQCATETIEIGINHCEAGAWLTKRWKLNSFIADAILYHHADLEQVKGAFPLVKIVYLAEKCCRASTAGNDTIYDLGSSLLGLDSSQLKQIGTGIEDEVMEVAASLGIKIQPPSLSSADTPGKNDDDEHEKRLIRKVESYSLLSSLLKDLVRAENRDAIFRAIEEALNILFGVETIFFFLHDFEKQTLYGCSSRANSYNQQLQQLSLSTEHEDSMLVRSMKSGKITVHLKNETGTGRCLADTQLLNAADGQGLVYAPMTAKGRPVGVIVIGRPDTSADELKNPGESELLQLLVNQAALSIYLDEVGKQQAEKIQASRLEVASMAASRVVHEINNPLGIIKNYLKILELKLPDQDTPLKELKVLGEEIDRISSIIQQLDTFSRPLKRTMEPTDVNALLADLVPVLAKSFGFSSDLQLHFKSQQELPSVMTDHGALKQIIINLVKNGAEAMPDGGDIHIETRPAAPYRQTAPRNREEIDHIEISIRDNGPGLPDEVSARLFDPFISTKGKGHSGLGLSIIKTLTAELNGIVSCTSEKGKGCNFILKLPVAEKHSSHSVTAAQE